jgi:DNA-directed RNA polymerase subunit RPC12/RpoP
VLTHYDVLGVAPDATASEIQHAWRVKLQLLHPDRHQGASADVVSEAARETIRVNEAWEVLRDEGRRARYDAELPGTRSARPSANPKPGAAVAVVTCPACHARTTVATGLPRVVCSQCGSGIRFAICGRCDTKVTALEASPVTKCVACGNQFRSPWLGEARVAETAAATGRHSSRVRWPVIVLAGALLVGAIGGVPAAGDLFGSLLLTALVVAVRREFRAGKAR